MALAWFFVSLALLAALVVQWRKMGEVKVLNEKLQVQVEHLDKEAKTAKATTAETQKELQSLRGELRGVELDLHNTRAKQAAAATPANAAANATPVPQTSVKKGGGGTGNMLKQMMNDPETAKAMAEQQRVMMNMMYGPLFKELGLNEEEINQFKELMASQQMSAMENMSGLTSSDPEERKAATEKVQAAQKDFEQQMKDFLGDDRHAKMQEYNSTLSERMTMNMYAQQSNLRPEQTQQLMDLFAQEKKMYQSQNPDASINPQQDWQKMMGSGEAMERHLKQQEEINARVLEKAQGILAPDQLKGFGEYLKNQQQLQAAGMKFAQKMMAPEEQPAPKPETPVAEEQP